MKQLLIGILVGAGLATVIFSFGGAQKATKPEGLTESREESRTETRRGGPVMQNPPPSSSVAQPRTSDAKATPSAGTEKSDVVAGAKESTSKDPLKAEDAAGTITSPAPVSQLFSGNIEGFPKLDEKTKKVLDRAQAKIGANQPEAAIEDMENAYRTEPTNAYFAVELAMMQADVMRNFGRTEEVLTDFLRREPDSKMVSAAYADFLTQRGREREATPYFIKAATGANAPVEAQTQLGHHWMRVRDFPKAIEVYNRAYETSSREVQEKLSKGESTHFAKQRLGFAALDSANAQMRAGDIDQAKRFGAEAEQILGPDHPQVRMLHAEMDRSAPTKGQKGLSE